MLGGEALGVIVVVDSTDPDGFARAKDMLKATKTEGLPSVIVANKANMAGALKPEEIRSRMALPEDIPIVPVVADDLKKVKKGEPCKLRQGDIEEALSRLFGAVV
jgi:signal recognition particle receptor subunit beta